MTTDRGSGNMRMVGGDDHAARRPRVVIVGGGFAGLACVRGLRRSHVDVLLIDRHNYHAFQPLLYQVATSGLSPGLVAPPLRWILRRQRNVRIVLGDVSSIDLAAREVHVRNIAGGATREVYDRLVVAAGARHGYFGHPEWEQQAPGLKTVDDALEIRRRILAAFEAAEVASDSERARYLTFAVVGAGPTGVELAGQIAEMARRTLRREYRAFDPADVRVLLIDAAPRVLTAYSEALSNAAERSLASLGVELVLDGAVTAINDSGLEIAGHLHPAATVIWAAGVEASPLARQLAAQSGAQVDRAERLVVDEYLNLPGHTGEVWVLGDMANTNAPGIAPVAMQQGKYTAAAIARRGFGGVTPFRYHDKGSLATIGRWRAVGSIGGHDVHGPVAWLLWLFIHLLYLVGFANRLSVLTRWAWSFMSHQRGERALTGERNTWTVTETIRDDAPTGR